MTIKQHIFNKDGLSYVHDNTQLLTLFAVESANINNCIAEHNLANDNILLFLGNITTLSSQLSDVISNTYNLLLDAVVLNNADQTTFSLFDNVGSSISNVTIDKVRNTIYLDKSAKYKAQITNINYNTNGDIGNSIAKPYVTRSNIKSITSSSSVEFERFDTSLQLALIFTFAENTPINGIKLTLSNISSVLPSITKIVYIDPNNNTNDLLYVGEINPTVAAQTSEHGNIYLQTEQVNATGLIVYIEQNYPDIVNGQDRYTIGISNFEAGYYESVKSGSAIFGPYNSDTALLKVAYSADIVDSSNDNNVTLSFSHNKLNWITLENTNVINSSKILNINNIDVNSVFFDNKVKQFWLRLDINSYDASSKLDINRRVIVDNNQSGQTILLNDQNTFTSVYESLGYNYGSVAKVTHVENSPLLEFAKGTNGYLHLEDESQDYNVYYRYASPVIEQSNNTSIYSKENILIETASLLKLTTPSDVVIKLNGVNVVDQNRKFVIKVKEDMMHGLYQLHIDGSIIQIDLSLGFVLSTVATLFKTTSDSATIIAPDEFEYTVPALEVNGTKYISLIGYVFEPQDTLHNAYPHIGSTNTFYIERGALVTQNLFANVTVSAMGITKSITQAAQHLDKHIIITNDIKKSIGSTHLGKYTFKKTAKMKHCNLVEGSVTFDYSQAFIQSMIKEVKFIDGIKEFVSRQRVTQFNNTDMNVIVLQGAYVDDGSISFYGGGNLFRNRVYSSNDLVEQGDWMLILEGGSYKIKLPAGIKTPSAVDIAIEYTIDNNSVNKDGIYSIDYINGVIYTSSEIDGNIIANYKYYNMALEANAAIELFSNEYTARDGLLIISKATINPLAVVYKEGKDGGIEFIDSPIISNISISTITESYIKWSIINN